MKTTDTADQAHYLEDAYATSASHGVPHAFLFCESDAMVAPFGLTYADRSPKPDAYATYQWLAHGAGEPPTQDPPAGRTTNLHGTVQAGGTPLEGLVVTAWGHDAGDLHEATTDALGIYSFYDLSPGSRYNVVVNAHFEPGGFVSNDEAHDHAVRDNVELVSGPDGWHGEDFSLAY